MPQDSLELRTTLLSLRIIIILASMVCAIVAGIATTMTGSATGSAAKTRSDSFDSLFVDKQARPSRVNPKTAAASMTLLPGLAPTVLHFNGNPPEDGGCTGNGSVDVSGPNANVCSTLTQTAGLSAAPAAKWVAVAGENGTTDRNPEDPNWLWTLSNPTTLSGAMTVNWWQACNAECVALGGTWRIRLWADGNLVFLQENVSATPSTPDVPSLLTATVTLPNMTANSKFVLHIDTQFVDSGQGATIFYDSQLPCPGNTTDPCDSTVTMPVVDPNATPTPTPTSTPAPTPGACDSLVFGGADKSCPGVPRYQTFYAPAGSSAQAGSGEFNIGFNPQTGRIMTMNAGPIWRLTPPELLTPRKPECCEALWEDKSAPTTNTGLDPILFTDQKTGRTFASNSTAGAGVVYAYSDNDGDQWVPFAPAPPNGGADHETIGSGPFPAALSMLTTPQNQGHYVLYCSQNEVGSACQRSLTLGTSWENSVPATGPGTMTSQGCGGLHGHVHIAPNGTAWLPDNSCRGVQGGAVSTDANTTPWTEFVVKGNNDVNSGAPFTSSSQVDGADPSIAIDSDNVAYYCYVNNEANGTEGHVHVAVSTDGGKTWIRDVDVGASHGIVNAAQTEAIGGSSGRAACGFVGTNVHDTAGSTYENGNFTGVWYAYIATTYDQGRTWVTVNATPNDPVQYKTGIWQQGGSGENGDRNLLDFNEITVDDKGHVLYGYSDGCVSPGCIAGTSGNDKVAFMRVARQSGGKSIFASYDVNVNEPAAPKAACLSGMRDSSGAHLTWRVPDNAGSDITGYQILRSTTPGGETVLVANTGTAQNTYNDTTTLASVPHYFYEVRAINAIGTGPLSIEADLSQPVPVATDDAVTTTENHAATINVLANDFDGGAPPLTVTSVSMPSHGAASNNADNTVTYTPATSFFGLDSFTYTIRNAQGLTSTGKVLVTVNAACAVSATGSFNDTLEPAAKPGWTMNTAINNVGPASPTWTLVNDPNAHSLTHSFFSDATTLDLKDDRLVTPPQKLSSSSHLIFWHRFQFEDGFDGGALEVSTDGGATWVDVIAGGGSFVSGGYNGSISGSFGSPIASRPAWTGGDATAAMTRVEVNLGTFAGLDRLVRFRLAADRLAVGSQPGVGWFVDDIQFTNTLVEASCATPTPTPTPTPAPTLSVGGPPVTFSGGPFFVPNPTDQVDGVPTCDSTLPCSDFIMNVSVPAGYDFQHYVKVQVNWTNPAAQFDLFVYTLNTDGSLGKLQAANFFAVDPDVVTINAVSGRYLLRVSPTIPLGDSYMGRATVEQKVGPATQGGISTPTFQNFPAPPGLGTGAGEPSIGVGLATAQNPQGRAMYQAGTTMLRVSFNDAVSPSQALWENKSAPNAPESLDPILFTDRQTGRTFTSQLAGACSKAAYTDTASPFNDGDTWVLSQGCGFPAGIDHQTIGGGPLHAPLVGNPAYPNSVYYCSQYGTQAASCALSVDGGLTFGPSVPIFTVSCFGIHGHVKVAPDGTVYVPDSDCSSAGAQTIGNFPTATARQALVFSEDNGITWSQPQLIPDSNPAPGIVDPSIGIGANGTVYYGYANSNGAPSVVVGHLDKTNHRIVWSPSQDVGAPFGIKNATFPAVVAGDDDRAAFAFLGTPTGGYYQDPTNPNTGAGFQGVWHVYVAITYDGGQTWTTIDGTPNDPVQRGSICNSGTVICSHTPNDRNLLDFIDATLDRQGRVLVAYADGCTSPTCINAGPNNYTTNDYVKKATIARQLSGKGLFAVFDGFIGQNVTSLIALQTSNPRSGLGISSFDLALKNTSSQSIFTPLTLAVNQLTSASGKVSINNADNGQNGAGASWSYSNTVGPDNILSAGELSGSRSLRFNNPGNEAFTVTFSVIGNLTQATTNSTSAISDSSATTNPSNSIDPGSSIQPAVLSNVLISVTYNPLLNTLTWQVLKQ